MKLFQRIGLWYLIIYFIGIICKRKIDMNNESNKSVENNINNIPKNHANSNPHLDSWEKDEDFWNRENIMSTTLVRRCMFFLYCCYYFFAIFCYCCFVLFFDGFFVIILFVCLWF